jgi:hypothetical protein
MILSPYRENAETNEGSMPVIQLPSKALKGLSFSIAELILIRSWSEARSLRMVVRLDHGSEAEEFEEVLAFHSGNSPLCHWIMWRDLNVVFVQPLIGRTKRYDSVAAAVETLTAKRRVVVTDIKASHWPA